MIYLTYNDPPSGIYSSQVIDVCNFFRKELNTRIKLIALVSLRNYWGTRSKIKGQDPDAIILPMFPGPQNWKSNYLLLYFTFILLGRQPVIARGPFATLLALRLMKNKMSGSVCFDARGAYEAEFNEYNVAQNPELNKAIHEIEKKAVLDSGFRIAVSGKLVEYWNDKFGYSLQKHVIIPCTVDTMSLKLSDQLAINSKRSSLGFSTEDILFVYSGSSSAWHSFKLLDDFLYEQMLKNPSIKILFLVDKLPAGMRILAKFENRVVVKWLNAPQVADTISCCDFGLLIRDKSVTNKVSAPVKFAEYMASGLKILISPEIGDYSEFVKANNCGFVINAVNESIAYSTLTISERRRNTDLASAHFSKTEFVKEYSEVIKSIS